MMVSFVNRHRDISMLLAVSRPVSFRVFLLTAVTVARVLKATRLGWGDVTCHRDRTEAPKISRIDPHREDAPAVICAPGFDARGIVWRPHQLHIDLMLECCRSDC